MDWGLRLVPSAILLQTLLFKFSGAEESVRIFTALGVEPYGRIGLGIVELITTIFLLIPKTAVYGAVAGLLIMTGAIISHVFILGLEVNNDGGTLFVLAVITFVFCGIFLLLHKKIVNY